MWHEVCVAPRGHSTSASMCGVKERGKEGARGRAPAGCHQGAGTRTHTAVADPPPPSSPYSTCAHGTVACTTEVTCKPPSITGACTAEVTTGTGCVCVADNVALPARASWRQLRLTKTDEDRQRPTKNGRGNQDLDRPTEEDKQQRAEAVHPGHTSRGQGKHLGPCALNDGVRGRQHPALRWTGAAVVRHTTCTATRAPAAVGRAQ